MAFIKTFCKVLLVIVGVAAYVWCLVWGLDWLFDLAKPYGGFARFMVFAVVESLFIAGAYHFWWKPYVTAVKAKKEEENAES